MISLGVTHAARRGILKPMKMRAVPVTDYWLLITDYFSFPWEDENG